MSRLPTRLPDRFNAGAFARAFVHSAAPVPARLIAALAAALRRWLPACCALCGQHGPDNLCEDCNRQFFASAQTRCRICAMPLPAADVDRPCGACLQAAPAFDATIVAADYAAPLDQLVLALKFGGRLALAPLFAQLLADALLRRRAGPLPALLTGVPLSAMRLQGRGFNQALEIARPLSRLTGIALAPRLLRRTRETQPQSLLAPQQRRRNIAGAFEIEACCVAQIAGKHIGVVDDVITTGQTLNEIALVLKHRGAARVTNLAFARTLR